MKSNSSLPYKLASCPLAIVLALASLVASANPAVAQVDITCPTDITVSNDSGMCSAVVEYPAPTVTGDTAGAVVTTSPPSGSTFPVGTSEVVCTVTNGLGAQASCTFHITVEDTEALVIADADVNKSVVWPPNHKMVKITVNYDVIDNCGELHSSSLSVSSNESENGTGDGNTGPDWEVLDDHHVLVRAERSGSGDGRVYTITITATDGLGNSTDEEVTVTVPKSRGHGKGGHGKGKAKGHDKK